MAAYIASDCRYHLPARGPICLSILDSSRGSRRSASPDRNLQPLRDPHAGHVRHRAVYRREARGLVRSVRRRRDAIAWSWPKRAASSSATSGTMRFRPKAAYETTVETTIYCAQEAIGKRIGSRLYGALFEAIKHEDMHRIVAGYTLPNRRERRAARALRFQTCRNLHRSRPEIRSLLGRPMDRAPAETHLIAARSRS